MAMANIRIGITGGIGSGKTYVCQTKIVGSKTDKLEFAYNYGECKKVPVRWNGRVIPEQMYFISHVAFPKT